MSKSAAQTPNNPCLAQILFRYIGETGTSCVAPHHASPVPGDWEMRNYQSIERIRTLLQEGVERERAVQILWEETCAEQDTVGAIVHSSMIVCSECVHHIVVNHSGESVAFLTLSTASATRGAFLLVSDRLTEIGRILGNISGDIQEKDILTLLRSENILDLTQSI